MYELKFNSHRSPIFATRGMVATSQPLAVAAGLQALSQGGNAADAAVATAAALNVTEPTSTGLGGDCFALYFQAETGQVSALNGSGRAPASLSLGRLAREGFGEELPLFHPYTITVPGACAGWCNLVERFGLLSLEADLAPALRLAEDGFPVAPTTAHFWERGVEQQLGSAPGGRELTIDGRAPRAGEIFHNPGLARTLREIAEGGKEAFYQGRIAEAIASVVQAAGGCLSVEDLAAHHSTWEEPLSVTYRGLRVWECPPNGQGLTALLALNFLEGFDLAGLPPLSAARLHLEITPGAVVVVDMIGDADQQLYLEHNSDPDLQMRLWEIAATLGYGDTFTAEYRYSMYDDHIPFARRGITAVDIIDFDYPYWHTTQDTPDKVSADSLERVGRVLEVWLEEGA